ncbi:helix-turn-helix domain-containing protein [Planktomarina sp.]|nr:helix-turn-helix domain-containing protein [Planktomarina sp.]
MIGRKSPRLENIEMPLKLKGFDDFQVFLGDIMRGERATLGKSLMDVQRELKIKATYIAGVENADPLVFDTPGFIAGYVRSYARYLGMDPEKAFNLFCKESGFKPIHGMSVNALPNRLSREERLVASAARPSSGLGGSTTPFGPIKVSFFSSFDIKAIVSSSVLVCLLAGLGFGAYTVVHQIQRVQMMPINQPPLMTLDLDPLRLDVSSDLNFDQDKKNNDEIYSRIYQPQALDIPILIPRDSPISSLNKNSQGMFLFQETPMGMVDNTTLETALGSPVRTGPQLGLQVVAAMPGRVQLVAEKGVWLRVKDATGSIIYEQIMDAQDPFDVPLTDSPSVIERAGNSGALFFLINGQLYGPAGNGTSTVKNIELLPESLTQIYDVYSPDKKSSFYSFVRDLEAGSLMQ